MTVIDAKNVHIKGEELYISTKFRRFVLSKCDILGFTIRRVPSFFDELGIELRSDRIFLITERARGFFDVVEFLHVKELFGSSWYSDAETGRELDHTFDSA